MAEDIKITGTIEDFPTIKPGKKGNGTPFKRIEYKISGKKMSVFDNILPNYEDFNKGDIVDVTYTVSGQYNNIKAMAMVPPSDMNPEEPKPTPASNLSTAAPVKKNFLSRDKDTECSIVAQVIIKATADMICAGKVEYDQKEIIMIELANAYKQTKHTLSE